MKGRYGETLRELAPYADDLSLPEEVRARALFYMGLSSYNLGRYDQAMKIFSDERVRKYFPQRSSFWYRRSFEMAHQVN